MLLFTEYKATQSLLLSELERRFGPGCATFINGDERAEGVTGGAGPPRTLSVRRDRAAERFNAGEVRFLVSTEAGGEGIDLQARCHSLIHVDLPWNPMRLHQRVGRLNRYGQTERVEVFTLRNPDTVESRIWDKLNAKIAQIMRALSEVMAEPEDLLQLVLGTASPGLFREVFAGAPGVGGDSLDGWFDARTARFGGRDALAAVRDLVGHCARFDFDEVAPQIPRLDLPDLEPFFRLMLGRAGRLVKSDAAGLAFKTPEGWADFPGARKDYAGLTFDRRGADPQMILGVGHRLVDRAIDEACGEAELVAAVPGELLAGQITVFKVGDRVTGRAGGSRAVVAAVESTPAGRTLLRDWELIKRLNAVVAARDLKRSPRGPVADPAAVRAECDIAARWLAERLGQLDHPFRVPEVTLCAAVVPATFGA